MKHLDRALAIKQGRIYFIPASACVNGHLSHRRVDNYRCAECFKEIVVEPSNVKNYSSRAKAKELGLKRYNNGKPCVQGHIAERFTAGGACCECASIYNSSQKRRDSLNKLYKENKTSREKRAKSGLAWAIKNRKTEKGKITGVLRSFIGRMINNDKSKSMSEKLGYSNKEFNNHISGMFQEGMMWSNHGEWHVDHIRPISSFYAENITDPKIINALSNLQPLWAFDNLSKGSNYESN